MPPIDTTALAAIFTWVWSQYGKTITDKTVKAAWERLRWEDRALAYGQKVQRLYGTMQILGQAKPVPLEGIFTAVSLLDKPTAWRRYTVAEMEAEFAGHGSYYFHGGEEPNRRDGLAMVRSGENLFILGKPGAGKTTFLKYLALKGVSGELDGVPIFIGLKQLADSDLSVFNFVVREFDVCDFPDAAAYLDRLLKSGKAILLFDGLDEVNVADDERARLITDVETFTRKYDQCQRLITCRLAANDFGFQSYTYVEMADFNEGQIREFVAKWFSGDKNQRERRHLFLAELEKAESEGLRELARVPLLLALLCLGFEETFKLSSRRVELYEDALDALLKKWDAGRNIKRDEVYRELSLKRKEQMLAQVAAETFDRAEYFIPKKTLARGFEAFLARVPNAPVEVDGEAVLGAIVAHHGLFMERAHGIYSFAHLTFQEYFTARYVVENEARGTLPQLIAHYADPRYREVFLLTAAQLADAGEFFDLFIARLAAGAQERPAVAALLRQAARKAATAFDGGAGGAAMRSFYVILATARTRILDRIVSVDLAFDLDLDRTLEFDIDFALDRAIDLDRAIEGDRAIEDDQAFDLDHFADYDLNSNLASNLIIDFESILSRAVDLARDHNSADKPYRQKVCDSALVHAVKSLQFVMLLKAERAAATYWLKVTAQFVRAASVQAGRDKGEALVTELGAFAERLRRAAERWGGDAEELLALSAELDAILAGRDLSILAVDGKDTQLLVSYLRGNRLLLECLAQAAVTDRQAIKNRLLLLPDA